ncbi:hypothetical protein CK203_017483 [Vitis vinifera]|uniref:Uncharacterized protein n=1 Tax=Vitis vinifera TaxID=29760 RepID=A0A438IY07_VITVI|nr:hypothetical protein CK203_017483 [Vitis vinifera]
MKFYFKNLTRHLHNPELPKNGWPSNRGRLSLKGCYSQLSFRTRPAILLLNKTYFQAIIFPYAWSKESLVLSPLEVRNQKDELESESLSETVHPHGRETRVHQSNKIQKDLVFDQSSYNAFWLFAVVPISDVIRVRTGERGELAERMTGGRTDMSTTTPPA